MVAEVVLHRIRSPSTTNITFPSLRPLFLSRPFASSCNETLTIKISIPFTGHNIDPQSTSICLLLDDRPFPRRHRPRPDPRPCPPHLLVIGLSVIESDHKPYESRCKLCDSYDLFFMDRKILPLLPRLLGKHFFKWKKIPLAVDSSRVSWPEQIKSLCESSLLYLRSGSSSMLKIGRVNMTKDEIVENAVAAMEGGWGNPGGSSSMDREIQVRFDQHCYDNFEFQNSLPGQKTLRYTCS